MTEHKPTTTIMTQRRGWRRMVYACLLLLGSALMAIAWMCWSESGGRVLLNMASSLSGGRLQVSGMHGRLADHFSVDELIYRDATTTVNIQALTLDWQPASLWQSVVVLNQVTATSVKISSIASNTPAQLPTSLRVPFYFDARHLALGRLLLVTMEANQYEREDVQLTAIQGQFQALPGAIKASSPQQLLAKLPHYQINTKLTSPWGHLQLDGQLQMQAPYRLAGNFVYRGQAVKELPASKLNGTMRGDLANLFLHANAMADQHNGTPKSGFQGEISSELAPFSASVMRSLMLDVKHLNPASFIAEAPDADVELKANLHAPQPKQSESGFNLMGAVSLQNTQPRPINQQGLPVQRAVLTMSWNSQQIRFSGVQIQLGAQGASRKQAGGQLGGEINVHIPATGTVTADARLDLKNVDLSQIDSRIQASNIAGTLQMQTDQHHVLQFQTRLSDPRALLRASAQIQLQRGQTDFGVLRLHQLVLEDLTHSTRTESASRLSAQGEMDLFGQRAFHVQGEMQHFDPARWIKGAGGQLNAQWIADGKISPQFSLKMTIPQISGQYAGQRVAGAMDLHWQQGNALLIRQLALQLGANQLRANGALGNDQQTLNVKIDAPDLAGLSALLSVISPVALQGRMQLDAQLHGSIRAPFGHATVAAQGLTLDAQIRLAKLQAEMTLTAGSNPKLDAQIELNNVQVGGDTTNGEGTNGQNQTEASQKKFNVLDQLTVTLHGQKNAHQLNMGASFDRGRRLNLEANGGLNDTVKNTPALNWAGEITRFALTGRNTLQMAQPMKLEADAHHLQLGSATFKGDLGEFSLEQLVWSPQSLTSKGSLHHVAVLDLLHLVVPETTFQGDLRVNGDWNLVLNDRVNGEVNLQRHSGDLVLKEQEGAGKLLPLGLQNLQAKALAGGLIAGTDQQRISLQISALGGHLGQWALMLDSALKRQSPGQISSSIATWGVSSDAPLHGTIEANIPDIAWISAFTEVGLALKGQLAIAGNIGGTLEKPSYRLQADGKNLELAFAAEGLLLPNGQLSARLEDDTIDLKRLQFSNTVKAMPKHGKFRDVNWVGQQGDFHASGKINWKTQTGQIEASLTRFPLVQRNDQWLVLSGLASMEKSNDAWTFSGKLKADGAYFKVPKLPPPSLSADVRVIRRKAGGLAGSGDVNTRLAGVKKNLKSRLDVNFDMGSRFVFVGRGIDTGLVGQINLKSIDGAPLQASGSIRTEGGFYEGYNQKLEIERGILNFQGPPSNPGLNIRALRKGLAVEAGVDVGGTVSAPEVRLISEPNVPDAEKISWLVLGRAPDQLAGNDTSLLFNAAGAIFGGDGNRNIPRDIVQTLGFDEFSVGAAENVGASKLPSQTIAGTTGLTTASGDQVVSVGKHIAPGIVLSVERGLSDASGAVKLSWQLTRRISIIGRSGTDSSIDANYIFSFH